MGIDRMMHVYENRRQSGGSLPLAYQVIQFAMNNFNKIPLDHMHQ